MENKDNNVSVLLMVVLLAFAVVAVDDRLMRTALSILPALILAQKAMAVPAAPKPLTGAASERRQDPEVRDHVEQLLKHFREFYTTCHLMGANVLTVEAAEERTTNLERDLNKLLAQVTETARQRAQGSSEAGG